MVVARGAFGVLWKRAPLWRFFVLLAPLLTAIFLMFPPTFGAPDRVKPAPVPEQASYTPPTASMTAPAQSVAPSTIQPTNSPPPQPVKSADHVAIKPAAPKTADLSLAAPGPVAAPDSSGLDSALMGRLYSGSISANGFNVPLPTGRWAVIVSMPGHTATLSGINYYLARIEKKRLVGLVHVLAARSNTSPGTGFPEVKECTQPQPLRLYVFVDGEMQPAEHQSCWRIMSEFTAALAQWADKGAKMAPEFRDAGGDLAAKGVSVPQDMVIFKSTQSDKSSILELTYGFSPEAEGISSTTVPSFSEMDWTARNISRFPEKLVYVEKIKAWGQAFWPRIQDAFRAGTAPR